MKQIVTNPTPRPSIFSQVDPRWTEKDLTEFLLKAAMQAPDIEDRNEAGNALGARFGDKAASAIADYVRGEAKDSEALRLKAVLVLGAVSKYSEQADRELAELALADSSERVRKSAGLSIASSEIAHQIVSTTMSVVYPVERRMHAVRALGLFNEQGLPGLRLALSDQDMNVRLLAVEMLGRMMLLSPDAERHLERATRDQSPVVSQAAHHQLKILGDRHQKMGVPSED